MPLGYLECLVSQFDVACYKRKSNSSEVLNIPGERLNKEKGQALTWIRLFYTCNGKLFLKRDYPIQIFLLDNKGEVSCGLSRLENSSDDKSRKQFVSKMWNGEHIAGI